MEILTIIIVRIVDMQLKDINSGELWKGRKHGIKRKRRRLLYTRKGQSVSALHRQGASGVQGMPVKGRLGTGPCIWDVTINNSF